MSAISELFHHLSNLPDLIQWAGFFGLTIIIFSETGLLVGVFLPGDSLLVTAGLLGAQGYFNVYRLAPLLTLAAICGNSTGYFIGWTTGPRIFRRDDSLLFNKKHATRAHEFYERHGRKTIILAQFMPIIRTFSPVVAGVGAMSFRTFFSYNALGAVAWIWSMVFTGYFLGRYIPGIDKHIEIVVIIVILGSRMPGVIGGAKARAKKRTKAAAVVTESPGPT
jgi:membrane-associated protein